MVADSVLIASLTVFGGIFTLVVGQIIIRFFIEPLQEQQKCVKEIAYNITFYANLWDNPGRCPLSDERMEAYRKLRGSGSKISAVTTIIKPFYPLFVDWGLAISYYNIGEVRKGLTGVANGLCVHVLKTDSPADIQNKQSEQSTRNSQLIYNIEEALDLNTNLGIDFKNI